MTASSVRLAGTFAGIKFDVKEKGKKLVHSAQLAFHVELGESGSEGAMRIVQWQKEPVLMDVSRRQLSLEGDADPQAQPALIPATDASDEVRKLSRDLELLRQAAAADEQYLIDAGTRVGIYFGNTTAGAMANEIERLRDQVQGLKQAPPHPATVPLSQEERSDLYRVEERGSNWYFIRLDGGIASCIRCGGSYEMDDFENAGRFTAQLQEHACDAPSETAVNPALAALEKAVEDAEFDDVDANVKIACTDGVRRKFTYRDDHYRKAPMLECEMCGEDVPVADDDEFPIPYSAMLRHICPPVCHKCKAEEREGKALADDLLFHHPECPKSGETPGWAIVMDILKERPYALRAAGNSTSVRADYVLEDASEMLAQLVESIGLTRSCGRVDHKHNRLISGLSKKERAELLKTAKGANKTTWERMKTLLDDFEAANACRIEMRNAEAAVEQERWRKQRDEEERAAREEARTRAAAVIAGPAQPYDAILYAFLMTKSVSETVREDWAEAARDGMTDRDLRSYLEGEYMRSDSIQVEGEPSLNWRGGWQPKVWIGPLTVPPEQCAPTLVESPLVDAVRRVMRVPYPTEEQLADAEDATAGFVESDGREDVDLPVGDDGGEEGVDEAAGAEGL